MPQARTSVREFLLPGVTRQNVGREVLAGITLLAMAVPINIGYAQIAGLPAQAGLYALILPAVVAALAMSSRQVVVSPDAAAAAMVASSLTGVGMTGDDPDYMAMAAAQAIVGGGVFLVCAKLKLGFLANFLSRPILLGFVAGLAIEIALSQIAKILGVPSPRDEFFSNVAELARSVPELHPASLAVGLVSLAILVGGRRLAPRFPWALVVLVVATVVSSLFDLSHHGVAVLGKVEAGWPSVGLANLTLDQWLAVVPSAVALTALTLAEGLMVAQAYARANGYTVNPDRDLTGYGLANIASGASGGFSVGISTSRTAAMDVAGARTQLPMLVMAAGALLLVLFGTSLLADVPSPAIGATVLVAVWKLLGIGEFVELNRISRDELAVALVCFFGVLLVGPVGGLLIAFVIALVNLTRRAAHPHAHLLSDPRAVDGTVVMDVDAEAGSETVPGTVLVRVSGPLFFANAAALVTRVEQMVEAAPQPLRHLLLDVESVTDVDTTAASELRRLERQLADAGTDLGLTRIRPALDERLRQLGVFEQANRHTTNRSALASLMLADEQPEQPEQPE